MSPSTKHPSALCAPQLLLRQSVSLAILDAILWPEWESRSYSFNGEWGEREMMASMRNGSGDDLFIGFGEGGVVVKGFDHEAPMSPYARPEHGVWPGMYDGLPEELRGFRDEPAFSPQNVTFCLWWSAAHPGWRVGVRTFAPGKDPDGSQWMLAIYDGVPTTYAEWAREAYEHEVPLRAIESIYRQEPLTKDLIAALNPDASLDNVLEESAAWPYGD
jgi:hypothetical protein